MDLLIRLLIWIYKEIRKSTESQDPTYSPPAATPERSLIGSLRQVADRLPAIEQAVQDRLVDLEHHEADLRAHVAPVLLDGVLAQAKTLGQQHNRIVQAIGRFGAQSSMEHAQQFAYDVQRLTIVLELVKELLKQRTNDVHRAVLGDADALAQACYAPMLEFAHHHELPIASSQPITLFYPGGTFIELAFINQKLAPIGLPQSYRNEPWRWPAIAHEIAHDFYASLHGLEPELIEILDLEPSNTGPLSVGTEAFDRFLYRVWLEEIFADAVGALMIGPAYLRAMIAIFRSPNAPEEVLRIPTSDEGAIDVHPPRHLRVHVTGRFLQRQGFGREVREMVGAWDDEHKKPETVVLTSPQGRQGIELAPLIKLGESIASRLYNAEFQTLAGHRLADIPGLDFSSMHVRRAEEARSRLAAGQPVSFDARALIAAATEASLDHPDRVPQINEATRLSIVGVGTGERVARVRALTAGCRVGEVTRAARTRRIVEALLLGEIIENHPRRAHIGH